jgi:hypothetical protein
MLRLTVGEIIYINNGIGKQTVGCRECSEGIENRKNRIVKVSMNLLLCA